MIINFNFEYLISELIKCDYYIYKNTNQRSISFEFVQFKYKNLYSQKNNNILDVIELQKDTYGTGLIPSWAYKLSWSTKFGTMIIENYTSYDKQESIERTFKTFSELMYNFHEDKPMFSRQMGIIIEI